jgi:hypothetical protein
VRLDEAAARALVTAGAATVVAGSFLAWVASGAVERSSFEMAALVERLGFSDGGAVLLAVRAWPVVPLGAALAVVATWWRRWRLGVVCAGSVACYAGAVALAVLTATDVPFIRVRPGAAVTLGGAIVLLGGATACGAAARAAGRVTRATRRAGPGPASAPPADPS